MFWKKSAPVAATLTVDEQIKLAEATRVKNVRGHNAMVNGRTPGRVYENTNWIKATGERIRENQS